MIAALYVQAKGCYADLAEVDIWPIERDARKYRGPWAVVAHPPCSRWCQLAYINQKRYGHKVGDDGGCFEHALWAVRSFGGVLEHPANTYAWPRFGLPRARRGAWLFDGKGYVTEVSQIAYGHRARKRTWLYCVSRGTPRALDWSEGQPTAQVSFCKNHGNSALPRLSKREAGATPLRFRELLLQLAREAK